MLEVFLNPYDIHLFYNLRTFIIISLPDGGVGFLHRFSLDQLGQFTDVTEQLKFLN